VEDCNVFAWLVSERDAKHHLRCTHIEVIHGKLYKTDLHLSKGAGAMW
jgi:hypothetical protein